MVRVYFMGLSISDPKEENQRDPPKFITLEELYASTGVKGYKIDQERYWEDGLLTELKEKHAISFEDEVTISKALPDYKEQMLKFFTEHLHADEEILLVLEGGGYFDVRDVNDEWIRIEASPGDMIIMPVGLYHRFTLNTKNYIRARRYISGDPHPTAYSRPADDMECRKSHLEKLSTGRWESAA